MGGGTIPSLYVVSGLSAVVLLLVPSCVVGYFTRPRERSALASLVTTLGFALALLCVGCVPIDIFAVSNAQALADDMAAVGAAKPSSVLELVRTLYEGLFTLLLGNTFVAVPLAFFYVGEPSNENGCTPRLCAAMKYTMCFQSALSIVLVVVLVMKPGEPRVWVTCLSSWVLGVFSHISLCAGTDISKFQEDEVVWIRNWAVATTTNISTTLRFLIACLSTLGTFPWLTFTAYGFARLPLAMLRGKTERHNDERLV